MNQQQLTEQQLIEMARIGYLTREDLEAIFSARATARQRISELTRNRAEHDASDQVLAAHQAAYGGDAYDRYMELKNRTDAVANGQSNGQVQQSSGGGLSGFVGRYLGVH